MDISEEELASVFELFRKVAEAFHGEETHVVINALALATAVTSRMSGMEDELFDRRFLQSMNGMREDLVVGKNPTGDFH